MTTTAIDLFAGAGGFTTGATAAGVDVLWAANHWHTAVQIHQLNHPDTEHSCQDLQQADWCAVPDHDLLLASPACQGHSQAGQPGRRGRYDRHQRDRNTAWAVISCAEAKRPRTVLVENVGDFYRWALYPAWRSALEALGYSVAEHSFDTADFGIPQNRRRAIITARLGDEALELNSPKTPWRGFEDSIDWDQEQGWAPITSKPPGVQKRVAKGRNRGLGETFLSHYVTGHPGRELERPIGTITTKVQWALVRGDQIRMLTIDEHRRAMAFPEDYRLPATKEAAVRMLGNAIPPRFAEQLCEQVAA